MLSKMTYHYLMCNRVAVDQGWANSFCKKPGTTYFTLYSHMAFATPVTSAVVVHRQPLDSI